MNRRLSIIRAVTTIALTCFASAPALFAARRVEPDPFRAAQRTPASISVYIGVDEVGKTIDLLLDSPMKPAIQRIAAQTAIADAWNQIAGEIGMEPNELFDRYLSRRIVIVGGRSGDDANSEDSMGSIMAERGPRDMKLDSNSPGEADDEPRRKSLSLNSLDWVIMTDIADSDAEALLKSIDGRIARWENGVPIHSAGDGALRLAFDGDWLIIADAAGEPLLRKLLADRDNPRLNEDSAFREATLIGRGQLGLFIRLDEREQTWMSLAANIDQSGMSGSMLRRTAEPALNATGGARPISAMRDRLAPHVVYTEISSLASLSNELGVPTFEVAGRPVRELIESLPDLSSVIGSTVITVIDRARIVNTDLATEVEAPTIAVAFDLADDREAAAKLDRLMVAIANWLDENCANGGQLDVPDCLPRNPAIARRIDLAPIACDLETIPGGERMELVWSTARSGAGDDETVWWVCSTNPVTHGKLTRLLTETDDDELVSAQPAVADQRFINSGALAGVEAAAMIATWPSFRDAAGSAAPPDSDADNKSNRRRGEEACARNGHSMLGAWHAVLSGIDEMKWSLARTSDVSYEATFEIEWAPSGTDEH